MSQRIVVVTGATGALGSAVSDMFRTAGDTVIGVSRSSTEFATDLSSPEQISATAARIVEAHGRIDVLVHTVGGFESGASVQDGNPEPWSRMLQLNFFSALYVCSSVVPYMLRAGRGRIVAVGSRTGVEPAAGVGPYGVSKAALHTLIQTLAAELRESGVTANVVLPSTMDTEANRAWGTPDDVRRWVSTRSVADAIFWLASDGAADVNGVLLPVYGRA